MKGAPLPFEFQRKGLVAFQQQQQKPPETASTAEEFILPCADQVLHFPVNKKTKYIEEPKSVLDSVNSSPTSASTVCSSLGGSGGAGGGGGLAAAAVNPSVKWTPPENQESVELEVEPRHGVDFTSGDGRGGEMEDWESVMAESGQEQSILRWIMGDVEDPLMGLNKMLHGGGTTDDGELSTGFGDVDQGYLPFDSISYHPIGSPPPPSPPLPAAVTTFSDQHHHRKMVSNPVTPNFHQLDVKPHQNPTFFGPLQHQTLIPPQPRRYNSGSTQSNFQLPPNPLQFPPSSIQKTSAIDEPVHHLHFHQQQQQEQGIIDQLFKAAETIQSGNNPLLAQSILARLNQQLSPIGKPFERAAFYFKEALQLVLHSIINNMNPIRAPFSLIFKIGAYKSFSEVSPLVQFTNFTCNQALLEALNGFDHVHIIDFDIKFGDQWASFMQELALRSNNNRTPCLKITTFTSPTNDHFELGLTRDHLLHFASEINIKFDFEIVNIDVLASVSWSLDSLPFRLSDNEAIAVNLPISAVSSYQIPLVLRFIKNLSPKIVVSVDRGCERTDLPFPNHLIHALQSFSNLLESLDAANMSRDSLQKIERFLIQPSVEKIITGRFSFLEKTQHWRSQFLSSGFSPLTFSNFTESQALCVIKRIPIQGFHIERRQSALVLCWQHRELVAASAWRC